MVSTSDNVGQTPQVVIRVSVEDKKLIKKLGGDYSEVWRLGFEKFLEMAPKKMQEKADYHYKMYKKCNDIVTTCNDIVTTRKSKLDIICIEYLKTGRSIYNPNEKVDSQDKYWIEGRLQKHKLTTSVKDFFVRCNELKQEEQ